MRLYRCENSVEVRIVTTGHGCIDNYVCEREGIRVPHFLRFFLYKYIIYIIFSHYELWTVT